MLRALDHLVIAFRDLAAAAERYRALGFQVGPRNRHPWGTENHIVQFDGVFLELIGLGAEFQPPAASDPVAPFAGFISRFLEHREGLAMIVARSTDAEADRASFAARRLGDFPRFDFSRKGMRGGREVEVAFSLAFAHCPALPGTGFFVCEQKRPENFWDKAAQSHHNGATGVAELTLAAPEAAREFLAAFFEAGDDLRLPNARLTLGPANALAVATSRGAMTVETGL